MLPLRDSDSSGRFPFWTITLIVVNVFVFFLELTAPNYEAFIYQYSLVPARINFADISTLLPFITSQFLHGGFLHIASNMLFLWVFGDNVEGRFGFVFFPIFYLFCGIIAGLSQYLLGPGSQIPMLGASGAVAGVLGAYYKMFPNNTIKTLVPSYGLMQVVEIPAGIMLIYWFITQIFSGAASIGVAGGVAYFAHIGGFATGWIFGQWRKGTQFLKE